MSSKLCCCSEPDLPDISVNVTCACCESHVEERDVTDSLEITEAPMAKEEDVQEDAIYCCCFRRKRHANVKKKKTR